MNTDGRPSKTWVISEELSAEALKNGPMVETTKSLFLVEAKASSLSMEDLDTGLDRFLQACLTESTVI